MISIQLKYKLKLKKIHAPQCSQQHYLQQPRHGSNLNGAFTVEWIKNMWYIYTMEYSVSVKVTQSCLTLCDPMGYTVHEILQARILEWGSHSLLQGVFPTQGSNLGLLHCRQSLPSRPPEHPDGILVCHKKEQINATCSNTDGPRDCHSE